jgi:hypothetical protein
MCRSYFTLPRILTKNNGVNAIDLVASLDIVTSSKHFFNPLHCCCVLCGQQSSRRIHRRPFHPNSMPTPSSDIGPASPVVTQKQTGDPLKPAPHQIQDIGAGSFLKSSIFIWSTISNEDAIVLSCWRGGLLNKRRVASELTASRKPTASISEHD